MREITDLNEFKEIQLDILKYVHKFCKKHDIKYSLGYGTLIGAVRHNGFIPWDDDIDIIMRRNEYERFIELFSKEKGRYKVLSHSNQKNYPLAYAKVSDELTLKKEDVNNDVERGLDIDVFPIDDLPDDNEAVKKQFRRCKLLSNILSLKQVKVNKKRSFYKNLVLMCGRLFFAWYPMNKLISDISKNAQRYNGCKGRMCAQMVAYIYKEKEIHPRQYSDSYTELIFEDELYPVISGYDAYMRQIYGDYMKLPPTEKQVSHHGFKAFWRD